MNLINEGNKFGELAFYIQKKFNLKSQESKLLALSPPLILCWKRHYKELIALTKKGVQTGLETGDYIYASAASYTHSGLCLLSSNDLIFSEKSSMEMLNAITFMKQGTELNIAKLLHQEIQNYIGNSENPALIKSENFDIEELLDNTYRKKDFFSYSLASICKLYIAYNFHYLEGALDAARETEKTIIAQAGSFVKPYWNFYYALTCLKIYKNSHGKKNKQLIKKARSCMKKMKKWSKYAPMNFLHKYYLIEAELADALGHDSKAADYYDTAIKLARENEYLHEEGLANELATRFWLKKGKESFAQTYFSNAYNCYARWGANAKVKDLENTFPELIIKPAVRNNEYSIYNPSTSITSTDSAAALDFSSVMKAAQTISGEILLEKLLEKMMKILIENAGAEKGFFIFETGGKLVIEAEAHIKTGKVTTMQSMPMEESGLIASTIVYYVERTKNPIVLEDASRDNTFSSDPYIQAHQPKSIICYPVINQGKLSGILYMENNVTAGAFTSSRLNLISILASQVAVSIDNARLYENLEQKVEERTNQLHEINRALVRAQEIADKDMKMAINVQKKFLPDKAPVSDEWDVAYYFRPMTGVSGDFYDFYTIENKLAGIGLFDVSGHGIASSLITMIAKSIIFQSFIRNYDKNLNEMFFDANENLIKEISSVENYLTGVILKFTKNKIEYVNAGHSDIFVRTNSKEIYPVRKKDGTSVNGVFLGIKDLLLTYDMITLEIKSNEYILMFTDCLMEARNEKIPFGVDRITKSFQAAPAGAAQQVLDYILSDFNTFVGNMHDLQDDLTVMVIKKITQ